MTWRGLFLGLLLYSASATPPSPTPPPYVRTQFDGCRTPLARSFPYCDESLTYEQRVAWLIQNMTLLEKIGGISPDPSLGDLCGTHTRGVARLGLPNWSWLTEANTQVAAGCIDDEICPTTFPGALGLAASFNRTLWFEKGLVIGTEQRAFHNEGWHRGDHGDFVTLTGYGPNINILRDPRFGRTSELPGEDPFLTGQYAAHYTRGMQRQDEKGRLLMLAYLKHFTAYSSEATRFQDNFNISIHDLFETYLSQYEMAFKEGSASGVMCSYNGVNGRPSCANDFVLNHVMRGMWNKPDLLVTTDCSAVQFMRGPPLNAPTDPDAVAWAFNNGTDIEMGSSMFNRTLLTATRAGLVNETRINQATRRWLLQHMQAGRFDQPGPDFPYSLFNRDHLNSSRHQTINENAGKQVHVLLKNEGSFLPLRPGLKIAVIGPQGVTREGLLPDYAGNDRNANSCMSNGVPSYDCMTTIADQIALANRGGQTTQAQGVTIQGNETHGIVPALELARAADVVVLVVGIDKSVEAEGNDRQDTRLPGLQQLFCEIVLDEGLPVVLVFVNGGQIAFDTLIDQPKAIIESFNPSMTGPKGLAELLFGVHNSWGRLPYTLYPHQYIYEQPMNNYDMSRRPGRTYKYYTGKPLYPFGFGLSYTTWKLNCALVGSITLPNSMAVPAAVNCEVVNTGSVRGDVIVQVYHAAGANVRNVARHPVPVRQLRQFDRVHVRAGETTQVRLELGARAFELVDERGVRQLYGGSHVIAVSLGQRFDPVTRALEMDQELRVQL